ncbi:MAG TPA: LemA family protein [Aquaticitalea sp.]|nr:LemA family protein [Aquaticitalea sp.]
MLAVVVIGVILYFISVYNKLIKLRNLVQEAWSGIDVFLKKRYDLIPNLVETVKGYASHEKETFENVTEARSKAMGATSVEGKQAAEQSFSNALVKVLALAENYPDLKANTNFQQLQDDLAKMESEIEKSRRYYNGTARDYNIVTETFPSNIVANSFNFEKFPFFEIENSTQRENPSVKF